jgi:hypothetical protein
MYRRPEDCRYRSASNGPPGSKAICRLLASLSGIAEAELVHADLEACEACCQHPAPSTESLTPVVASLLYRAAVGILRGGGVSTYSIAEAESLRTIAIGAMESVLATLLYEHEELIDHSVTAATLTDLLLSHRAFAYLRYGDGEWLSVLGCTGVNGDGHDFLPETLGRELRQVLEEIAGRRDNASPVFVGTTHLMQEYVQPFIVANDLQDRVTWVSDAILRIGLADLTTRRFVEAVAAYDGP